MPRRRRLPILAALLLALAWLFLPLSASGVWDPIEPEAADLARRIAVHRLGGVALARAGDPRAMPTLTDLGSGELPFTSIALSFRLFGVHEWSGRLPLALWGVAGALALFVMLDRLVSARAAFFGLLALLGAPLYFLHARTMPGDIVAMAAFSMAMSGGALALVERRALPLAMSLGLAGLGLGAGFLSRGLLLGVASPLAALGLAAVFGVHDKRARVAGVLSLALSAALTGLFLRAALPLRGQPTVLRVVGFVLVDSHPSDSTFDLYVRHLGHALFPWSAVLPLALGRLMMSPPAADPAAPARPAADSTAADSTAADRRNSTARLTLLSAAIVSFAAATLVAPWGGLVPFAGVAALAGAFGVLAHDLSSAPPSRLAALVSAVLLLVLYFDFSREPARALAAFAVDRAAFPKSFTDESQSFYKGATAVFLAAGFFALAEPEVRAPPSSGAWTATIRAVVSSWIARRRAAVSGAAERFYVAFGGNLVFACVVFEAALVGLAAVLYVGKASNWQSVAKLPRAIDAMGSAGWWAAPLGVLGALAGWALARDLHKAAMLVLRAKRATMLALAGGLASALLAFGYYPALGAQLSPRDVIETLRRVRARGDEVGLLGTSPRAGAFYLDEKVKSFDDVARAHRWLTEPDAPRRFLLVKSRDLAKLNSLSRGAHRGNIPVLDARSSENILVSSAPGGAPDENPFARFVLDEAPYPAHPLHAVFVEHLELIGWEIVDEKGRVSETLQPGRRYVFRSMYRVLKRLAGSYKAFLHIDGHDKRHNGDHAVLGGNYATTLWQPGDFIVDEVDVELDPNFGAGEYSLYFGFFQEGDARLKVTEGEAQADRVIGGKIRVR
ncbi:MAG: glycosyltransferase family 39 protein [Polyangiaceae bacterium]